MALAALLAGTVLGFYVGAPVGAGVRVAAVGAAAVLAVVVGLRALKLPLDKLDFFADAYLTHAEMNALLQLIERRVKKRAPVGFSTISQRKPGSRNMISVVTAPPNTAR
jgi:deoxycytidylate deaminase